MANVTFKDMRAQILRAKEMAQHAGLDNPTTHPHGEYFHFIDGALTLAALTFPRASGSMVQRKVEIRQMIEREYGVVL